jgi:sulfite reductase alpha subunit-like flavoprotein
LINTSTYSMKTETKMCERESQYRPVIHVLYGSQTGCAQECAERISRELKRRHFSVKLSALDRFDYENALFFNTTSTTNKHYYAIFVVSTTGQGDEPDNMRHFWRYLMRKNLRLSLKHLRFSVLGLGDSSYPKFNFVCKKLHRRLLQLGAVEFCARGLADDQDTNGVDDTLVPWMDSMLTSLLKQWPLPSHMPAIPADALPPARYHVTCVASDLSEYQNAINNRIDHSQPYTEWNPFMARVLENRRLTSEDNEQDIRHISFDISETPKENRSLNYSPGDVLALWSKNDHEKVMQMLKIWNIEPDQFLRITKVDEDAPDIHVPTIVCGSDINVRAYDLFEQCLAINGVPKRYFFELLSKFAEDEEEKDQLQWFGSVSGASDFNRYCYRERRTFLEVMTDFKKTRPPLDYLLDLIPPILPRFFSISSSQLRFPTQVHITVSIVKFTTPYKKVRYGMCSSWLSRLTNVQKGIHVPIWIRRGTLKFPPVEASVILVGPGTGMAPFRSLIQQRMMEAYKNNKLVGPTLFFFGNRYAKRDYLYQEEWDAYISNKQLAEKMPFQVITAFSRDQPHKIYVQHRIRQNTGLVWDMIQNKGAFIYIAGNAKQMPTDVWNAFQFVVEQESGVANSEVARQYLTRLEKMRRYQQETWS